MEARLWYAYLGTDFKFKFCLVQFIPKYSIYIIIICLTFLSNFSNIPSISQIHDLLFYYTHSHTHIHSYTHACMYILKHIYKCSPLSPFSVVPIYMWLWMTIWVCISYEAYPWRILILFQETLMSLALYLGIGHCTIFSPHQSTNCSLWVFSRQS